MSHVKGFILITFRWKLYIVKIVTTTWYLYGYVRESGDELRDPCYNVIMVKRW